MNNLAINEQLGGMLIGFSIYDALHEKWLFTFGESGLDYGGIDIGEFTLVRGLLIVLLCTFIAINLTISYRINSLVMARKGSETILGAAQSAAAVVREKPWHILAMLAFAVISLAMAYWGIGMRQAFLLFIGFGFVNSGPLFTKWMQKID